MGYGCKKNIELSCKKKKREGAEVESEPRESHASLCLLVMFSFS
jgi:hypothetical protein